MRPKDAASNEMLIRIKALNPEQLPPHWDGSVELPSK